MRELMTKKQIEEGKLKIAAFMGELKYILVSNKGHVHSTGTKANHPKYFSSPEEAEKYMVRTQKNSPGKLQESMKWTTKPLCPCFHCNWNELIRAWKFFFEKAMALSKTQLESKYFSIQVTMFHVKVNQDQREMAFSILVDAIEWYQSVLYKIDISTPKQRSVNVIDYTVARTDCFSANLINLMEVRKLNWNKLSKDLGIFTQVIGKYKYGKNLPRKENMFKICNYLQYYDIYRLMTCRINFSKEKLSDARISQKPSSEIFAKNLQYLLDRKGENPFEFIKKVLPGSGRIVYEWMNGRGFPKWDVVIHICRHFEYYDIYALFTMSISKNEKAK
jgi:hypothetical protein